MVEYAPIPPSIQKCFGTISCLFYVQNNLKCIQCSCSHVAAMQLMEYAPNSPSIQKRFGTTILHGNKMLYLNVVNSYLMGIETSFYSHIARI